MFPSTLPLVWVYLGTFGSWFQRCSADLIDSTPVTVLSDSVLHRSVRQSSSDHFALTNRSADAVSMPNELRCDFPPNRPGSEEETIVLNCRKVRVLPNGTVEYYDWYRAWRYYPYEFSLTHHDKGGSSAESSCILRKNLTDVQFPSVAAAVIRSPVYAPVERNLFQLHFSYSLGSQTSPVHDLINPSMNFFLEVRVGGADNTFPSKILWGRKKDYASYNPTTSLLKLHSADVYFTAAKPFHLYFIAYHNDNCTKNVYSISVTDVRVLVGFKAESPPASRTDPYLTSSLPPTTQPTSITPAVLSTQQTAAETHTQKGWSDYWIAVLLLASMFCMMVTFIAGIMFLRRKRSLAGGAGFHTARFRNCHSDTGCNPEYFRGSNLNGSVTHYEVPLIQ